MKIGVLGTGMVGGTIATKLVELDHEVQMGSRDAFNEKAAAWVARAGEGASQGTFADAAAFGELVFNCTAGAFSLEAVRAAGGARLAGKVLVDVANPLDFSQRRRSVRAPSASARAVNPTEASMNWTAWNSVRAKADTNNPSAIPSTAFAIASRITPHFAPATCRSSAPKAIAETSTACAAAASANAAP